MARKQLTPTKREQKDYDKFAGEAIFEAEFLALVMEHPHTPNEIIGGIRFLLIGACRKLLKNLEEYNGDGQMVRDIMPHAYLVEPGFFEAFRITLKEVEKVAPRVVASIQKNADAGRIPPRYPHPLKEYFQNHRETFVMAGKKGEVQ
jgi:hypothetical protein